MNSYYPYGMQLPSGAYASIGNYTYGYNGMEKDDELKGSGKLYSTLFREGDTENGRWWSRDPLELAIPYQSPYLMMDDNPISVTDIRGLFGSRDEAKAYRSENNLKGRIFENVDGEFSIDDNKAGTSIWNQPGIGIQKGILIEEELVEGKISNLPNDIKYVYDPLPSIERNREMNEEVPAIILHRTVSSNGASQFKRWVESNKVAGTHFLVGEDGMIFQTGNLKKQTIHLYDSPKQMYAEYFGKFNNTNTIGIEVIGNYNAKTKTWDPLTSDQCKATAMLVLELTYRYNLEIKDLFPHEKVQRKTKGEGQVVLDAIMEELLNGW